jgi:2-methylcitrate dehydratase PrpD
MNTSVEVEALRPVDDAGGDRLHAVAQFVRELSFENVPADALDRARLLVMDTLGVMIAGASEAHVARLADSLRARGSRGRSTFATGGPAGDAGDAAMVNAVAACAHVLDEGHKFARGHVGTYVLPAVLAAAEERDASGAEFLTTLIAGYEIAARMGIACRVRESMHPSGTWGTVGAAAAVARLAGFSTKSIREVMNVAAPLTLATSWQAAVEGATVRDLYSGCGAASAVAAVRYVDAGFTGSDNDVAHVFGQVVSERFDEAALTDGLGRRWEILRNYFKVHACCRNFQSGIDVALELRDKHRLQPGSIVAVRAFTFAIPARDNASAEPRNVLAARESFPVSLGLALLYGRCDASVYTEQRVFDPALRSLAQRVHVECDPALDALFPRARPTRLVIDLADGRTVEGYAEVALGDPDRPLPVADLEAKFESLVGKRLGIAQMRALRGAIDGLDQLASVADLTRPLRSLQG